MQRRSTRRRWAMGSATVLLAMAACVQAPDLSWKNVTIAGADRDAIVAVCREIVTLHFTGTKIAIDAAAGKIQTDPIEEVIGGKVMREQCYVDVIAKEDGEIEIALFAPMTRKEVDLAADLPVRWITVGSDVRVEGQLLDEICGRILATDIDARIVGSNLPRLLPGH